MTKDKAMLQYIEFFSFITGTVYMVMQIVQHKWMWYVNILTCTSAIIVNCFNHLWGVSLLNAYFICMALYGIYFWRKMRKNTDEEHKKGIKMNRITGKILILSAVLALTMSIGFFLLLKYVTNDPDPLLDSLTFSFSIIAAWWLARAYPIQWFAWMMADITAVVLYVSQGLQWMSCLYIAYTISSIIGFINWTKKGEYV